MEEKEKNKFFKSANITRDWKTTALGIVGIICTALVVFGVIPENIATELQTYLGEIITAIFSIILIFINSNQTNE